jgi:hypothetical protein
MRKFLKNLPRRHLFSLALIIALVTSCGDFGGKGMDHYVETMQSGFKILPWPNQMEALYGEGDHFITHYGFSDGPKTWQTVVSFYDRYTLTMAVDVNIDYGAHKLTPFVGHPKFYLQEVKSVEIPAGGGVDVNFANECFLDEEQWKKLVASGGDWSKLGIPVKTNSPVPGFEAHVKAFREPLVKIPH